MIEATQYTQHSYHSPRRIQTDATRSHMSFSKTQIDRGLSKRKKKRKGKGKGKGRLFPLALDPVIVSRAESCPAYYVRLMPCDICKAEKRHILIARYTLLCLHLANRNVARHVVGGVKILYNRSLSSMLRLLSRDLTISTWAR